MILATSEPGTARYQEMLRHAGVEPSLGLLGYPVLEAADVIAVAATHVAVGPNNLSHLRLGQDLVRRLADEWGCNFTPTQPVTGTSINLPGLDGNEKMSKSLGNAIQLSDSADEVAAKVRSVVTHDAQGRFVIGEYLQAFSVETDPQMLEELSAQRRSEAAANKTREQVLAAVDALLSPVRRRLVELRRDPGLIDAKLAAGRSKATKIAEEQLGEFSRNLGVPLSLQP